MGQAHKAFLTVPTKETFEGYYTSYPDLPKSNRLSTSAKGYSYLMQGLLVVFQRNNVASIRLRMHVPQLITFDSGEGNIPFVYI